MGFFVFPSLGWEDILETTTGRKKKEKGEWKKKKNEMKTHTKKKKKRTRKKKKETVFRQINTNYQMPSDKLSVIPGRLPGFVGEKEKEPEIIFFF